MKTIIPFLFLLLQFKTTYGCTVACGIPDKFDPSVFILEGKVVSHAGDFTSNSISGEFAAIKVKISTIFYSPKKIDYANLIIIGLSADCRNTGQSLKDVQQSYPVGTVVTFFAFESNLIENNEINLSLPVCSEIFKNGFKTRIAYDYESQRKKLAEFAKRWKALRDQKEGDSTRWIKREILSQEFDDFNLNRGEKIIPQRLQLYFDLLKIHNTKRKKKRFKILKTLIWSEYMYDVKFIEAQDISEKMKNELIALYERIQKEWVTH